MYLVLKLVHVFGAVIFLGNIIIGIFWKRWADRTHNAGIITQAIDGIIAADRWFTIPGVIILVIAGIGAALVGGIPILGTGWLLWGIIAFVLSGLVFAPLSRNQRSLSKAAHAGDLRAYESLSKNWDMLGTLSLLFALVAFVFMILKPALPAFHR